MAQVLGVDDQGVVEAGKRADIIAMPGDPLADIANTMKVDFVMKDGILYDAKKLAADVATIVAASKKAAPKTTSQQ